MTVVAGRSSGQVMTIPRAQFGQLKQNLTKVLIEVIDSYPLWRVVGPTDTVVRAIPSLLERALPAIGTSSNEPGSAWLTLDFWIDDRPKARLGVFWRSNPVRDREARNRILKALVESRGTGFEYKGTKRPYIDVADPAFSGKTVSDHAWWPSGGEPDLQAVQEVIRGQLGLWSERLHRIAKVVSTVSRPDATNGRTAQENSAETEKRSANLNVVKHLASKKKSTKTNIGVSHLHRQGAHDVLPYKIKLTPPLPEWAREDRFPDYTNIHELLKSPRLTPEQRAENTRRLYGTETMEGFNDWNASVLLLAKDAFGDTLVFASYHTSDQVMNNPRLADTARRVWAAAGRAVERAKIERGFSDDATP